MNDQVVVDAEGSRGGVGLYSRDGGVHLVVDDAIEGDVAVVYDDVDGVESDRRIVGNAACHPCETAAAGSHGLGE